jgi:hypothetical protein
MLFEVIREEGTGKREEAGGRVQGAGGRGQGAGGRGEIFFFLLSSFS